jgi:hypothetical protein
LPLSEWGSIEVDANERKLTMHANSARPHTAKVSAQFFGENLMKSATKQERGKTHVLHQPHFLGLDST